MSDPTLDTAPAPAPAPAIARESPSRAWLLILVLVLAAAIGWVWIDAGREADELRAEVAKRLADADVAIVQMKAKESDLADELREVQAKLTLLEARVAESQSQQASLEALYRELSPSRDELALTEVEQVLVLASQQLALAGNVQAALAAVQVADSKLARIDRPRLAPLRRALAADMDKLKAVPFVDVVGLSARLDQAVSAVDQLPLAKDERLPASATESPPADLPPWRRALADFWAELRALVRIEMSDRPAAPLVTPSQQFFLRENLRLRLMSARIELLARNDVAFKADIKAADTWVKQYFDTRTRPVQTLTATLVQLAAVPMPSETPDLSASLTAVRTLKAAQDRRTERAPAGR